MTAYTLAGIKYQEEMEVGLSDAEDSCFMTPVASWKCQFSLESSVNQQFPYEKAFLISSRIFVHIQVTLAYTESLTAVFLQNSNVKVLIPIGMAFRDGDLTRVSWGHELGSSWWY